MINDEEYEKWHKNSEIRMGKSFNEAMESINNVNDKLDIRFDNIGKSTDGNIKWLKALLITIILSYVCIGISLIIAIMTIR